MNNLEHFGNFLKNLRLSAKLTQNEASNLIGINKSTLWRLENGYIMPSFETILKLSRVYRINIKEIIEQINDDPVNTLYIYENFIEEEIAINIKRSTIDYAKDFKEISDSSSNEYVKLISTQYYYFLIAVDCQRKKDYISAIDNLIYALKLNIMEFDINQIELFSYNNIELRILMNLSNCYYYINDFEKYESVLSFCNNAVDLFSFLYIQVKYSYSLYLNRKHKYKEALDTIDTLIQHCQKEKAFTFYPMIYYQKSVCHENLKDFKSQIIYLQFSKELCEAYGYDEFLDAINRKIKLFGPQI